MSSVQEIPAEIQDRNVIGRIETGERWLDLHWADGHQSRFHNLWLRDNCFCSECGETWTGRRYVMLTDFAPDIHPLSSELDPRGKPHDHLVGRVSSKRLPSGLAEAPLLFARGAQPTAAPADSLGPDPDREAAGGRVRPSALERVVVAAPLRAVERLWHWLGARGSDRGRGLALSSRQRSRRHALLRRAFRRAR